MESRETQLAARADHDRAKLELSRQWTGILADRLALRAGLSTTAANCQTARTGFSVANRAMLKRLLVMLSKSRRGEKRESRPAKPTWHFSPREVEKKILSLLAKEKEPPRQRLLARIPMLKRWLERGREKTEDKKDACSSS